MRLGGVSEFRPSCCAGAVVKRMVENVYALTVRSGSWQDTTELVGKLNRALRGGANYFAVGTVTMAYRAIDIYTAVRLHRWLRFKHNVRRRKGWTYAPRSFTGTSRSYACAGWA
jgi:group II intron maturase